MVNNLVFRWPKPLFFIVLGAHGIYIYIHIYSGFSLYSHRNLLEVSSHWQFSVMLPPALWHSPAKQPGDAWFDTGPW